MKAFLYLTINTENGCERFRFSSTIQKIAEASQLADVAALAMSIRSFRISGCSTSNPDHTSLTNFLSLLLGMNRSKISDLPSHADETRFSTPHLLFNVILKTNVFRQEVLVVRADKQLYDFSQIDERFLNFFSISV